MYEISFDQYTFGGSPYLQWRMLPISVYIISFDQYTLILGTGSTMENGNYTSSYV